MQILKTSTLSEIRDGMLAQQFDTELVKIHSDCVDRPLLKKARKVTLEITITPTGEDDPLESVDIDFSVKSTIPATKITRQMKSLKGRNGFGFDSDTDSIDHAATQRRLQGLDDEMED